MAWVTTHVFSFIFSSSIKLITLINKIANNSLLLYYIKKQTKKKTYGFGRSILLIYGLVYFFVFTISYDCESAWAIFNFKAILIIIKLTFCYYYITKVLYSENERLKFIETANKSKMFM